MARVRCCRHDSGNARTAITEPARRCIRQLPQDYRCAGLRVRRDRPDPDEMGWGRGIHAVLALVDPRAESPMESRTRMALHVGGLPAPAVQHPVATRNTCYYLDLAYPHVRWGIEYDGAEHRTRRRARRDLIREATLTALGWHILRFDADVVLFRPDRIVAAVRGQLVARAAG